MGPMCIPYLSVMCLLVEQLHYYYFTCRMQFESVVKSMLSVGFDEEEIVTIVALLAGVILIGDIVSQMPNHIYCFSTLSI